jgi:hypothetical protein
MNKLKEIEWKNPMTGNWSVWKKFGVSLKFSSLKEAKRTLKQNSVLVKEIRVKK